MTSHLTFPYKWVDCVEPENCSEHIHHEEAANTLNSYPLSWVESLLHCIVTEDRVTFYDSNQKPHHYTQPAIVYNDGTSMWFCHGNKHRKNGPAVEWGNGHKEWYINDKRHRVDGPARQWVDGTAQWWFEDKIHRVDGPAVIYADGTQEWWLNGVQQSVSENMKEVT